jgi:hypothetical protein
MSGPPEFSYIPVLQFTIEVFFESMHFREVAMDETTRVRAHLRNIEHYQNLLKTKLSEIEQQFLERRLSEERFAVAMLNFMSPSGLSAGCDLFEVMS